MSTPDEFAAECEAAAKALRRLPKDVRRALASEVKSDVAEPLSRKIAAAAVGPWNRVLRAGTKARSAADPQIVVGGMRPKLSGGGGPRSVVYGTEFGGGKRRTAVPSKPGRRGYSRRSTAQFARHHQPFVFKTIGTNIGWVLDRYADIVDEVIDREIGRG